MVHPHRQRLFNLRRNLSRHRKPLLTFTDAQSRASCRAWYGNCSAHNRKVVQRVVRSAQCITGDKLPALQDTYSTRYHRKAKKDQGQLYCIYCIYCTLNHLLHLAYAARPSLFHIYFYVHILIHSFTLECIQSTCEIVRLLVSYYCTVGTRSSSISLHSQ